MTAGTSQAAVMLVEIGAGELIDKITILEIKAARIADPAKRANVAHELATLERVRRASLPPFPGGNALEQALKAVNLQLWLIEDEIRECDARGDFGPQFVALARAVYQTNDRRAALKKEINTLAGSTIIEEKSYAGAP